MHERLMHISYQLYVLTQEILTPQIIAKLEELTTEAKELVSRLRETPLPV